MNTKNIFLSCLILCCSLASFAQTILISDIDDTLKMSHVLNQVSVVDSTIALQDRFLGMSDLYQQIAAQSIPISYVTNAPASIMTSLHQAFLNQNHFPKGDLFLKETMFQTGFKLKKIREILNSVKPSVAVLIGDNGESDPEIYHQIETEFPKVKFHIFIHQLYWTHAAWETGSELAPGETGYVTSVDLAVLLKQANLISPADSDRLIEQLVPKILKEGPSEKSGEVAFPAWMDCRDYHEKLNDSLEPFQKYLQKLESRCNHP